MTIFTFLLKIYILLYIFFKLKTEDILLNLSSIIKNVQPLQFWILRLKFSSIFLITIKKLSIKKCENFHTPAAKKYLICQSTKMLAEQKQNPSRNSAASAARTKKICACVVKIITIIYLVYINMLSLIFMSFNHMHNKNFI